MTATTKPFFALTAADLMNRHLVTIMQGSHLRDAARTLAHAGIHGAPVIDEQGKCVGVLSSSDLARWALNQNAPPTAQPRTCQYQETLREVGGEVTLCRLPFGVCPIQCAHQRSDGEIVTACAEPRCVPVDWQVVHFETLPEEDVQHYMTACPVTATEETPIDQLARRMIATRVGRLIILDDQKRPVGVVSSSDLIAAIAGCRVEEPDNRPVDTAAVDSSGIISGVVG